ncbi:hypothetical protein [Streptomyces flavalbus]|uniref:Uncharacterized protein n=1 Tax=Streptomyces flavalbus TaxID=2665155 RepID=A0ABW2W7Y6_9ACTN
MSIAVSTTTNSGSSKDFAAFEDDDGQKCTVHPDWCTETGIHDAHFGARHVVMGNDGRELLNSGLLDFTGSGPVIGLSETDTDATEAVRRRRSCAGSPTTSKPSQT